MRQFHPFLTAVLSIAALFASAGSVSASWRSDLGTFRIGMIEANAPTPEGRLAVKRAFEAALGMPAEISVLRDWPQLIDAQASGRVNYAIYSASAYATAAELCQCVEPLVAPLDSDGAAGLKAVVLARTGKANTLSDLPKLIVATPSPDDLLGWLVPMNLLPRAGLMIDGDQPFLLKEADAGAALQSFRDGRADAVFGWERAGASEERPLPGGTASQAPEMDTAVLWRSPLIRFGPHAVRKALDGEAKRLLAKLLIDLRQSNPQAYDLLSQGHGGGFLAVQDTDYDVVRQAVRGLSQQP